MDNKELAGLLRDASTTLGSSPYEVELGHRLDVAAAELEAEGVEPVAQKPAVIALTERYYIYDMPARRRLFEWQIDPSSLPETVALYTTPAPAVSVPDGYALVPVEPTEKMLDAIYNFIPEKYAGTAGETKAYKSMLAAAPQPESALQVPEVIAYRRNKDGGQSKRVDVWLEGWLNTCNAPEAIVYRAIIDWIRGAAPQPEPAPQLPDVSVGKLVAALRLARDMFTANDLDLPHTFEVIDDALATAPQPGES